MKYWVFVSYSREDQRWAKWVHSSLERYRLPSKLVGTEVGGVAVPKRLFPAFRDRDELPGSADLGQALKKALADSHALVVVCSPAAAASKWVNEEIRIFKTLGRSDRIQYLVVDGEPNATDTEKPGRECFPEAARFDETPAGLTRHKVEPLAVDVRDHADGKLDAKLKLVAGILGLDFDQLKRRDRRRGLANRVRAAAIAIGMVSIAGSLWYNAQRDATRQQMNLLAQRLAGEARRQLTENNEAERALLLVLEAHRLSEQYSGSPSMDVDRELRHVLGTSHFSVAIAADGARLTSVAFSPSGNHVAASGNDNKIRIWDVATKNPKPRAVSHSSRVWSIAFSPDSQVLAGGMEDGRIAQWSLDPVSDPILLRTSPPADAGRITAISYDGTGRLLAASSNDGAIYVWDLQSPDTTATRLCCHNNGARAVAFQPMNRYRLATAGGDRTVKLWDLRTPTTAIQTLRGAAEAVRSLAFSPNGRWVAAGTERTLDVPSLSELVAEVDDVDIVVPSGGNVFVWKLANLEMEPLLFEGHEGSLSSLVFADDEGSLISAAADKTIRMWNVARPDAAPTVLRGHTTAVAGLALSPDGHTLASVGSGERPLRLWSLARPAAAPVTLSGHTSSVRSIAFSPSGDVLATVGSMDASMRLWRLDRLDADPIVVDDHVGNVVAVTYDPKGRFVATGAESVFHETDNTLRIWSLPSADSVMLIAPHFSSVLSLAFGNGGSYLVSAGRFDETLHVWDLSGSTLTDTVVPISSDDVLSLVANPSDRRLVWGTADGELWFWDLDKQRTPPVPVSGHRGPVHALAASPLGDFVVSGGEDSTVSIWDWDEPRSEPTRLLGHEGPVYDVAVDSRGTHLASGGGDGTVRMWSLADPRASPIILYGSSSEPITVTAVALSPDGTWIAAGANDMKIRLWPRSGLLLRTACQMVWRNLTVKEWNDYVGGATSYRSTCELGRSVL